MALSYILYGSDFLRRPEKPAKGILYGCQNKNIYGTGGAE